MLTLESVIRLRRQVNTAFSEITNSEDPASSSFEVRATDVPKKSIFRQPNGPALLHKKVFRVQYAKKIAHEARNLEDERRGEV